MDIDPHVLPSSKAAPPPVSLETATQPPPSYSVIFDNLDFYMSTHHQSQDKTNKSIHWTHLMAVEDRVSTHHLSKDKPTMPVTNSFAEVIKESLPSHKSQYDMRQEFIVLGARILTQHLDAFKPFNGVVINHIPHQYSETMSRASTHVSAVCVYSQCIYCSLSLWMVVNISLSYSHQYILFIASPWPPL